MFKEEHLIEQLHHLYQWADELQKKKVSLAICSGNHDSYGDFLSTGLVDSDFADIALPGFTEMLLSESQWMRHLPAVVCGDGQTICFKGKCILTSCEFAIEDISHQRAIRELMKQGRELKKVKKLPWIVIHHEPPAGINLAKADRMADMGNSFLSENLREFQPDIVLSGHVHNAPFLHGTCCEQYAKSHCFNVGHQSDSAKPHWVEIALNDRDWNFIWHRGDRVLQKGKIPIPRNRG